MTKDFISEPNDCGDCPIAKISPLGAKIGNLCHKFSLRPIGAYGPEGVGYDVEYGLDDLGKQICRVRQRKVEKS